MYVCMYVCMCMFSLSLTHMFYPCMMMSGHEPVLHQRFIGLEDNVRSIVIQKQEMICAVGNKWGTAFINVCILSVCLSV